MQPMQTTHTTYADPGVLEDLLVHEDYVKRMARGLLKNSHDSEDVVQQTWLEVLTRRDQEKDIERPRTWLARVAWSRSIDLIRRQQVRQAWERGNTAPESVAPDEELADESVRKQVLDAVRHLSEPYLTTVQLRFYENLPPREIARRTGVPVETVRTRLKRAMKQLRGSLDREFGDRRRWTAALIPLAYGTPMPSMPNPKGIWKPFVFGSSIVAAVALAWLGATGSGARALASEAIEENPRVVVEEDLLRALELELLEDQADTDDPGRTDIRFRAGSVTNPDRWNGTPPTPFIDLGGSERSGEGRRVEETGAGVRHAGWAPPVTNKKWSRESGGLAARASDTPLENPTSLAELGAEEVAPVEVVEEAIAEQQEPTATQAIGSGKLLVVDPAGTGDFTTLAAAVAEADTRDAIVLHPLAGGHDGLQLLGRGVTIFAAEGTTPRLNGLLIKDLRPGQTVVLRGLAIEGVDLRDDHGRIWFEDCSITTTEGEALAVRRSDSVNVIRSTIRAEGVSTTEPPRVALYGMQSEIYLYDSQVVGAAGARADEMNDAATGGTAALTIGGSLFAANTTFEGGAGGEASLTRPLGGAGGVGLRSEGEVRTNVCAFVPGAGGEGPSPGHVGVGSMGPLLRLHGATRTYEVDSPVRVLSDRARLSMSGDQGDVVFSVVGGASADGYLCLHLASRLVQPPYMLVNEGLVGPDGRLEKEFPIPVSALHDGYGVLFMQGFFFATDGEAYLGSGSAVLLLPE